LLASLSEDYLVVSDSVGGARPDFFSRNRQFKISKLGSLLTNRKVTANNCVIHRSREGAAHLIVAGKCFQLCSQATAQALDAEHHASANATPQHIRDTSF